MNNLPTAVEFLNSNSLKGPKKVSQTKRFRYRCKGRNRIVQQTL